MKEIKTIALFSGGLDSTLAIKLIKGQGIEVIALHFFTPFCTCKGSTCIKVARELGLEFHNIPIADEFLEVLRNPEHGYGKNLNPCIDCRILMLRKAKVTMDGLDAAFIVTGEVVGQRPMSQNRKALIEIEKSAGLEGLLLRPLSAKILPETIPEKNGWVDRENLLGISGRSRKVQMELAGRFAIKDYATPAGGCLLTDPIFSRKVRDLIKFNQLNMKEVASLRIGRHFRLNDRSKLIVGREKSENGQLQRLGSNDDLILEPESIPGPVGIYRGDNNESIIKLAARIVARYSDLNETSVTINCTQPQGSAIKKIAVEPIEDETINQFRI